jgi:hypothetical protein
MLGLFIVLFGITGFAVFRSMNDYYIIESGVYVNHSWNAIITVFVCSMTGTTVFTFLMGLFIYWLVFDLALNTKRELPWYYVGKGKKSAFTDRLIGKFPRLAVFIKVLLVVICGYLHLKYKTLFPESVLLFNTWM